MKSLWRKQRLGERVAQRESEIQAASPFAKYGQCNITDNKMD